MTTSSGRAPSDYTRPGTAPALAHTPRARPPRRPADPRPTARYDRARTPRRCRALESANADGPSSGRRLASWTATEPAGLLGGQSLALVRIPHVLGLAEGYGNAARPSPTAG